MWLVPITLTGVSSRRVLAAIASKPGPATPAIIPDLGSMAVRV
jgi:hypothetical protein